MTMSCTITEKKRGYFTKVSFACVSSSGGAATGTSTNKYSGELVRVVFVPGTSGNQPSDAFDVLVNDDDTLDVLAGTGANITNASNTTVVSGLGAVVYDNLSISASGLGDTKQVTVHVYLKQ